MCGRYTLKAPREAIAEAFDLADVPHLVPRYNIAPIQPVPLVRLDHPTGARALALLRWGLVPPWADDPALGNRLINARAETLADKPAFRAAFRRRRCLVVADGFYRVMWTSPTNGGTPREEAGMRVAKQRRDGELHVELLDDDGAVIPVVAAFLRHLRARGCSPNTLLAYAHDLQRLFRFLRSARLGIEDFTPARALDFLAYLRDVPGRGPKASARPLAPTTVSFRQGCMNPLG